MSNWTDKENWIHKKPLNPQQYIDTLGLQLSFEEIRSLEQQAWKLNLAELDELSKQIGILFPKLPGEKYVGKESYISALHEADDYQKIYRYLEDHGIKKPKKFRKEGPVDTVGKQITWEELRELKERASTLSLSQLDELVTHVGVKFHRDQGYYNSQEFYINALVEADDFDKVRDYLKEHGV